jgi:hypothetical protein
MVQEEHRQRLRIVPDSAPHPISEVGIQYLVGRATTGYNRRRILESKGKLLRLNKEKIPDLEVGSGQSNSSDGAKLDSSFESRITAAPFRRVERVTFLSPYDVGRTSSLHYYYLAFVVLTHY